jgi:hypothetical protein
MIDEDPEIEESPLSGMVARERNSLPFDLDQGQSSSDVPSPGLAGGKRESVQ